MYQCEQLGQECEVVAFLNCLRYLGIDTPEIGTRDYFDVLEKTGSGKSARKPFKTGLPSLAKEYGVVAVRPMIPYIGAVLLPAVIPDPGETHHAVAVTGYDPGRGYLLVNRYGFDTPQWVSGDEVNGVVSGFPDDIISWRPDTEYENIPGGISDHPDSDAYVVQRLHAPWCSYQEDRLVGVREGVLCVLPKGMESVSGVIAGVYNAGLQVGVVQGKSDIASEIRGILGL